MNEELDHADEKVYDAMRGERRGITREGGEEERRRMRGIPLTDVNYLPKISFEITCLKCITSFQFIRNNRKLLNCPKYEKVSIEGMFFWITSQTTNNSSLKRCDDVAPPG